MNPIVEKLLNDQLLLFATPVFLLVMCIEIYISHKHILELYNKKDTITSMLLGIVTLVFEIGFKLGALLVFELLHDISPLRDVIDRQWWAIMLLFFLDDFSWLLF